MAFGWIGTSSPTNSSRTSDRDMLWIPGGTFLMGSEDFYPEEGPVHEVTVDGFWMDRHIVTNEQFAHFRSGYALDSGRDVSHGFGRFLSRGRPCPRSDCRWLLDGSAHRHQRTVRALQIGICFGFRAGRFSWVRKISIPRKALSTK